MSELETTLGKTREMQEERLLTYLSSLAVRVQVSTTPTVSRTQTFTSVSPCRPISSSISAPSL